MKPGSLAAEPLLDQPPDRLGAGGFGSGWRSIQAVILAVSAGETMAVAELNLSRRALLGAAFAVAPLFVILNSFQDPPSSSRRQFRHEDGPRIRSGTTSYPARSPNGTALSPAFATPRPRLPPSRAPTRKKGTVTVTVPFPSWLARRPDFAQRRREVAHRGPRSGPSCSLSTLLLRARMGLWPVPPLTLRASASPREPDLFLQCRIRPAILSAARGPPRVRLFPMVHHRGIRRVFRRGRSQ